MQNTEWCLAYDYPTYVSVLTNTHEIRMILLLSFLLFPIAMIFPFSGFYQIFNKKKAKPERKGGRDGRRDILRFLFFHF